MTEMDSKQQAALKAIERSATRLRQRADHRDEERDHLYALLRRADRLGVSRTEIIRAARISRRTFYRLVGEWSAA